MYYLKLLKEIGYIDRSRKSDSMIMTVDAQLTPNTTLPIVVDKYIISEAKVLDSSIFGSRIRVILNSLNPMIPHFEIRNTDTYEIKIRKHASNGTTESQCEEISEAIKKNQLVDIRPVTPQRLKLFVSDLYDYEGLTQVCMNVRFKL